MTTTSYGNRKSRVTTLSDFGVEVESEQPSSLELVCEKSFFPYGIEPIKAITRSRYYQTLVFRTKQERDRVATAYRSWLNKQRGIS
ncbi:hypothetical protein M0R01_02160 [bacterium]|nr:hypothetical protein [bacterium]